MESKVEGGRKVRQGGEVLQHTMEGGDYINSWQPPEHAMHCQAVARHLTKTLTEGIVHFHFHSLLTPAFVFQYIAIETPSATGRATFTSYTPLYTL